MYIKNANKIYIIGIEGAGTSALACALKAMDKKVSGSDEGDHFYENVLKNKNIKVYKKIEQGNIPKNVDLIIYSSAFNSKINNELKKALNLKIPVLSYAQALAEIINQKYSIAVCGTHGKTTTSAWLGFVMKKAGLDPNVIVGAKVPQFKGNNITGKSKYLVVETDEYQNKLKYYNPKAVLLNNIEYDHPDFFKTEKSYEKVFIEFIKNILANGFLVANFDDPIIKKIVNKNCHAKIISYNVERVTRNAKRETQNVERKTQNNYTAFNIQQKNGKQYFKVKYMTTGAEIVPSQFAVANWGGTISAQFCIQLAGKHNIYNALAVIAACEELGIKTCDIKKYLRQFKGVNRRMQIMGKFKGATIIDDYAHHPTEIENTLAAIRLLHKNQKIIAVFQPHTFTRTKALLDNFAKSFYNANEAIILDIFGSAREKQGKVHSKDLVEKIKINNNKLKIKQNIKYIATLDKCEKYLRKKVDKKNIVVLMGASDIYKIGKKLLKNNQVSSFNNQSIIKY
ncbi:MAG: UDP-N-acetylmuramate--L-alanine ligase [Patescibacteria group bacterium]